MNYRVYEFNVGITTSTQPDASSPTLPNDLVTLSYVGTSVGTEIQEQLTGINGVQTIFTLAHTPITDACVKVYIDGILQRQGVHYTILGAVITFITAPATGQDGDVNYKY